MHEDAADDDLSLRELARWADGQARHIAAKFGLGPAADGDNAIFVLLTRLQAGPTAME